MRPFLSQFSKSSVAASRRVSQRLIGLPPAVNTVHIPCSFLRYQNGGSGLLTKRVEPTAGSLVFAWLSCIVTSLVFAALR